MNLVLLVALLLVYFFSRQFVKHLQLIVERAKQIADADLPKELHRVISHFRLRA